MADPLSHTIKIGVIIVNFNGGSYILRSLEALQRQTMAPARVMVVDNSSTDGSLASLRARFPNVEVLETGSNLGFAAANNLGARAMQDCGWLALLNPDAFPAPEWIEALARAVVKFPNYQFFGSRMLMDRNPEFLDGVGDAYHVSGRHWRIGHGLPSRGQYLQPMDIFAPCAAAALYRRDVFEEVGGFDEDFFCYAEDVDLGFRLRLRGYCAQYVPDAIVRHIGSGIVGTRSDFAIYHGHRNMVWTYLKNIPGWRFWIYLPLHLIVNVGSVLLYGKVALRSKTHALKRISHFWRKRREIQRGKRVSFDAISPVMSSDFAALLRRSSQSVSRGPGTL